MKALFLPSYLGGGFGHISRCLTLADALEKCGWQTAFALGGQHTERVRSGSSAVRRVYALSHPRQRASGEATAPAFTVLGDMNYQLVRDGLVSPAVIRACVAEQLGAVRDFRPDVLVGDVWPLAGVLAHLAGLPLAQIVRSAIHPAAPDLIWWQACPQGLVSPDPRPVFNPLLEAWGLPPIQRAEDLLVGDLYLVPSFPELDPLPDGLADTTYIGPLVSPQQAGIPEWLNALDPACPLVYVTTGGGAESVGGRQFYLDLIEALRNTPVQAVISTGANLSPDDLPPPPAKIRIESWVPGQAVIARSRLVVYSGGYGTTMEMVQAGVPGLVIPFHTEQESNARRLEAAGAARFLLPSQGQPIQSWHRWPGGRFSTLVYLHSDLTPALLRESILDAVADEGLLSGAQHLQSRAMGYRGAAQAVDLIEGLVRSRSPAAVTGWERLNWWQKLRLSR